MKRLLLAAFAIMITASASAESWREAREREFQEKFPYRHEVRLGWGGYPILDVATYPNGYSGGCYEPMMPGNLNNLYGTAQGAEYMTGLISGEFSIHFKRWFTFAVEAGFNGIWGDVYDRYDGTRVRTNRGVSFTIIPHARFYWANCAGFRMYSGIGLGITFGGYDGYFEIYPAAQLSPVGITAGKKIFFFAESSIGTSYMGGKFGLGYRF